MPIARYPVYDIQMWGSLVHNYPLLNCFLKFIENIQHGFLITIYLMFLVFIFIFIAIIKYIVKWLDHYKINTVCFNSPTLTFDLINITFIQVISPTMTVDIGS